VLRECLAQSNINLQLAGNWGK